MNAKLVEPIKYKSAADKAFESIRDLITNGSYKPGDILPTQTDLARQLKVSRNTLREAISRLTTMGLLETKSGTGTMVKPASRSDHIGALTELTGLDNLTIKEYIETRLIMEKAIVDLIVTRADDTFFTRLKENLTKQKEASDAKDAKAFLELDLEFHFSLSQACNNSILHKMYQTTLELLVKFMIRNVQAPSVLPLTLWHHISIYNALKDRDARRARRAVEDHVLDAARKGSEFLGYELDLSDLLNP